MDAMDFTESSSAKVKKCQEYMEALEEERRKIQVFQRELPLSLDLINQAIENCRQKLEANNTDGEEEEGEQTTSNEGPVLEEFIPLKRTPSSSDFKHLNKSSNNNNNNNNNDTKVDWMKSVQLWNQNPDPVLKQELPKKTAVIESKKIGGAFHPFHKSTEISSSTTATTTTITTTTTTPTPPSSIATSSTTETVDERDEQNHKSDNNNNRRDEKERDRQGGQSSSRKTRRCWSPELHRRFLHALQQLGGSHVATPKQIRELMKVDGLTNDEVKSHLQKYRLHTRRPSPAMHNNGNTHQPPQFVVVGGIWVPPQEYSTAVAVKGGDSAHGNSSNGIYAPVALQPQASSPPIYPHQKQQQQKQQQQQSPTGPLHSSEEGRSSRAEHSIGDNDDDGDNDVVNCRSPSMSSSTHNSTASLTL